MTKIIFWQVATFIVMCASLSTAQAQSDSTVVKKSPARKVKNTTKIELLYRTRSYEKFGDPMFRTALPQASSRAGFRVFTEAYYQLRINGNAPVNLDKKGDILRPYYVNCFQAKQELEKSDRLRKITRISMWAGYSAGTAIAFSSLYGKPAEDGGNRFLTRFGIGAGLIAGTTIMAYLNYKRAGELVRLSVHSYNDFCYNPVLEDSILAAPASKPVSKSKPHHLNPDRPEPVMYELIRNDPAHSGLAGFAVTPLTADIHGLNVNLKGGVGAFYTYKSFAGFSVDYQIAYLDNPNAESSAALEGSWGSKGVPAHYRRSSNLEFQTKFALSSWTVRRRYGVHLGSKRSGGRPAEVLGALQGDVRKSVTARAGYQLDNRLITGTDGLNIKTNTEPYRYEYQGRTLSLTPALIGEGSTMMRSGIISAGVGISSYWDIQVSLDSDAYVGTRTVKIQRDVYFDVLYAQQIRLDDMLYYHGLHGLTEQYAHISQELDLSPTRLKRTGARLGYKVTRMNKHVGHRIGAEAGIRPGSDLIQDNAYLQIQAALIFGGRVGRSR